MKSRKGRGAGGERAHTVGKEGCRAGLGKAQLGLGADNGGCDKVECCTGAGEGR